MICQQYRWCTMTPYITIRIPRNYMHELYKSNKNKFHAFNEWLITNEEIEFGLLDKMHSLDFFAESWGQWERQKCVKPKSTKTVRDWMKEFEEEMEKFDAGWAMRRWQNSARARNSHVKKQTTPQSSTDYTPKEPTKPTVKAVEKVDYTPTTPQLHQIKNIYDDDNASFLILKEFENLFMTYRAFNAKYAGKKAEALDAYVAFRKAGKTITMEELKRAIGLYMQDGEVKKKNGFKSFIENELYFEYVDKNIKLKMESGEWMNGSWSYVDEILYNKTSEPVGTLNRERFNALLKSGRILLEVA